MSIGPIAPQLLAFRTSRRHDLSSLRYSWRFSRADATRTAPRVKARESLRHHEGPGADLASDDPPRARHLTQDGLAKRRRDQDSEAGTDAEVTPGEVGELCFRGPRACALLQRPGRPREALTADALSATGDLAKNAPHRRAELYYSFEAA